MRKKIIISLSLFLLLCINSHAQENKGWQDRLRQTEKEFKQLKVEVDIMYKLIHYDFAKRYGQKKYHEIVFGNEIVCPLCNKEEK